MAASIKDEEATQEAIAKFEQRHKRLSTPAEQQQLTVFKADWRQMWVESNPDAGWVKQEVLNPASHIHLAGTPLFKPYKLEQLSNLELDPATSVHIASTDANVYLPKDYVKNLVKNKPAWWVNRFVHSSFEYAEGLVYPAGITNARTNTSHILSEHPRPPRDARFILALDYGLSDPAGILLTYVDPSANMLIIYDEYYAPNNHIADLSQQVKHLAKQAPPGSWLMPFIIDPKSGTKRDYQKKSLIDLFAEHGIHFQPASTPHVEPGVYKLNSYFEDDRIAISPNCRNLIKELETYSFTQAKDGSNQNKPEDKNNHLLDPLRWIVMELPADPKNLTHAIFNAKGQLLHQDPSSYGFHALTPNTPLQNYQPHYIPALERHHSSYPNQGEHPWATTLPNRPSPNAQSFHDLYDENSRQTSYNNVTISQQGGNTGSHWNPLDD